MFSTYPAYSYDPYAQQAAYQRALAQQELEREQLARERYIHQLRRLAEQEAAQERAYRQALAQRQRQEELALRQQRAREIAYQQALRQQAYERALAERDLYFHPMAQREASLSRERRTPSPSASHHSLDEETMEEDDVSSASSTSSLPLPPTKDELEAAAITLQRHFRLTASRRQALAELRSLSNSLSQHRDSYIPPSQLEFQPTSTSSSSEPPKLAYGPNNAPHLAADEFLVGLLTKCDGISTGGDKVVREARKALVREIEVELKKLDAKKAADWERLPGGSSSASEEEVEMSEAEEEVYDAIPLLFEQASSDSLPLTSGSLSLIPEESSLSAQDEDAVSNASSIEDLLSSLQS